MRDAVLSDRDEFAVDHGVAQPRLEACDAPCAG
jgi:hypothetical protein